MEARKPYQSSGNPEKTLLPCEGAPRCCYAPHRYWRAGT